MAQALRGDGQREAVQALVRVLRAVQRQKVRRLHARGGNGVGVSIRADMPFEVIAGAAFEDLVDRLITAMGFRVLSRSSGPDGGIDMIAVMEGDLVTSRYAIQCKCYSGRVGVGFVRELCGVVSSERLDKGILITNSEFTGQALEFAAGKQIELVDGSRLDSLVGKYLPGGGPEVQGMVPVVSAQARSIALTRELRRLRDGIVQRRDMLDRGLVPMRMLPLQSHNAAVRFVVSHLNSLMNTVQPVWNQLDALRQLVNEAAAGGRQIVLDEVSAVVTNMAATIPILEELRLEAYCRFDGSSRRQGNALTRTLVAVRDVHKGLFTDIVSSLDELLTCLESNQGSPPSALPEMYWEGFGAAFDTTIRVAEHADILLNMPSRSQNGATGADDIAFLRRRPRPQPPVIPTHFPPTETPGEEKDPRDAKALEPPPGLFQSLIKTNLVSEERDFRRAWPHIQTDEEPIGILLGKPYGDRLNPCVILFTRRRVLVIYRASGFLYAVCDVEGMEIEWAPGNLSDSRYVDITLRRTTRLVGEGGTLTMSKVPRKEMERILAAYKRFQQA